MSPSTTSTLVHFYYSCSLPEPTVTKTDYAKWMLDDPRVNFAISKRGAAPGFDTSASRSRTRGAGRGLRALAARRAPVLEEGATTCCYAKSEKSWIDDPQGVEWETFLTTGESTTYGSEPSQA